MAMASLQLNNAIAKPFFMGVRPSSSYKNSVGRIRCAATTPSKRYTITLLPGDGIGPEVISVATNVLKLAASLEGPFNSLSHLLLPVI